MMELSCSGWAWTSLAGTGQLSALTPWMYVVNLALTARFLLLGATTAALAGQSD